MLREVEAKLLGKRKTKEESEILPKKQATMTKTPVTILEETCAKQVISTVTKFCRFAMTKLSPPTEPSWKASVYWSQRNFSWWYFWPGIALHYQMRCFGVFFIWTRCDKKSCKAQFGWESSDKIQSTAPGFDRWWRRWLRHLKDIGD